MLPSATLSAPPQSSTASFPLLPKADVATSSHLKQFSAVGNLARDLQQQKPRHHKRPQRSPGESDTPMTRFVHTSVYKQKLNQHNEALKHYERFINQLLSEQGTELTK